MTYKEQIKHPKWQKRRLEIMEKDNFTCQICGDKEAMLNVHHLHYHKGRDIWDYKDWELITLCESCHELEHVYSSCGFEDSIQSLRDRGITNFEINALLTQIDINLYLGDEATIQRVTGPESGAHRDNEIEYLTQRRMKTKK